MITLASHKGHTNNRINQNSKQMHETVIKCGKMYTSNQVTVINNNNNYCNN